MGKLIVLTLTAAASFTFSGCGKQPEIPHTKIKAHKSNGKVTLSEEDFAKCIAVNKQLRECCVSERNR